MSIVAVVGRPNVGKSTLFNYLVGRRLAIVEDVPGVTRDRLYADVHWLNHEFTLVDTGGLEMNASDELTLYVRKQAEIAIREADVILFVVDGRQGLTAVDEDVAQVLRGTQKPLIVVVNKIDHPNYEAHVAEFYQLGLPHVLSVSAANGLGIGDLLDLVVEFLPGKETIEEADEVTRVAVIGKPNTGKSSLVNALLGQERVIVSDIPGTTRDAVDTPITVGEDSYVLVDTAGLRRRSRVEEEIERYSGLRSLRAIERADIVLMVIDATEGITEQDKKIVGFAHNRGKGIILVVNKWDLIEKDDKTINRFTEEIKSELVFVNYAPIIFLSAKTGQRVHRVLDLVKQVNEQRHLRIATNALNELILQATMITPTPTEKGKRLRIYYATQSGIKPPTFVFFVNEPELMHFSYQRFLENTLRKAMGFVGTPIRFYIRKRRED
ncbi:MAG TPA: ribosome biogenesis GTPase Der [Firmicutes bacterium]|jgi:GTP-binding protein|nr:ribosome biogenesis GTPase Der [Bacillota bacterium]